MAEQVQKDQWYVPYSYSKLYVSANCLCLLFYWYETESSKFYRVTLVLKVMVAILDPLVRQDLKGALVSLASKDSW